MPTSALPKRERKRTCNGQAVSRITFREEVAEDG